MNLLFGVAMFAAFGLFIVAVTWAACYMVAKADRAGQENQ